MARNSKPEEIIAKLREAGLVLSLGGTVREACLCVNVSEQTYHRWRKKYGDPQISDADRIRFVQQENARLHETVSDLTREKQVLRRRLSTLIFVGGAPRTGTTLLQGLICTSPRTNDYIAECSYLTAFMEPYRRALDVWEAHTQDYFDSVEDMRCFHADVIRKILSRFRTFLGGEELVLKDPCLTPSFYTISHLLPEARFAVMIRDPRDSVSSRLEVMQGSTGDRPGMADIEYACTEYNGAYAELIQHWRQLGDRIIFVSYDALVSGNEFNRLAEFGFDDLRPDQLTKSSWLNSRDDGNPWNTDLYGGPLSAASIGRHRTIIEAETARIIIDRCGETARSLFAIAADLHPP